MAHPTADNSPTPRPRRRRSRVLGRLRRLGLCLAAAGALCLLPVRHAAAAAPGGSVLPELPAHVDPRADYLIYLHGRIIEDQGPRPTSPRFGVYEYRQILDALAARGFTVVSQVRPKDTDSTAYAAKVAAQVAALLAAGVPPHHVAVVGFSKGGAIALLAAARLHHAGVRTVSLAGCGDWLNPYHLSFASPVLSLYDAADDLSTSCAKFFAASRTPFEHSETVLHVGQGHGTFYRPNPAWIDPLTTWLAAHR